MHYMCLCIKILVGCCYISQSYLSIKNGKFTKGYVGTPFYLGLKLPRLLVSNCSFLLDLFLSIKDLYMCHRKTILFQFGNALVARYSYYEM